MRCQRIDLNEKEVHEPPKEKRIIEFIWIQTEKKDT